MTKFTFLLLACCVLTGVGRAQTSTITTLQVPSQPIAQGVPVLVQASVTQNGVPVTTGTVTFCPAGTYTPGPFPCGQLAYGTAQVTQSGTASTYIGLPPGITQVVAIYRGTKTLAGSVSGAQGATIAGGVPTSTSLQVSGTASSGYDFVAKVVGNASTSTALGGSVSFLDSNNNLLETIDLTNPTNIPPQVGGNSLFGDGNCTDTSGTVIGDVNGDGYLDVLYNPSGCLQLGAAGGSFKPGPQVSYTGSPALLADFNSDGILDLVTSSGELLYGNGDGSFSSPVQTLSLPGAESYFAADFDGDGTLDLGVTSGNGFYIYFNSASGLSTAPVITAAETGAYASIGDFNHDGIVDLAVIEPSGNTLDVLLGKGDGTFTLTPPIPVNDGAGGIATADMNLDGLADLVVSGTNGPTILIGNGDGTFEAVNGTPLPNYYSDPNYYGGGYSGPVLPMGASGVAVAQPGAGTGAVYPPDPSSSFTPYPLFDSAIIDNGGDNTAYAFYIGAADFQRNGIPALMWFDFTEPGGGGCAEGGCYPEISAHDYTVTYSPGLAFDSGSLPIQKSTTVHATYTGTTFASSTSNAITVTGQNVPTITWPTPSPIAHGIALSSTQLDATANVAGTFTYNPGPGTLLTIGSHTLSVTFTPADTSDYTGASASVVLTVVKAAPLISWPMPASIVSGTTLSSTQLDATANVAGTFTYNPGAGSLLSVGTHTLITTFTPADTTNYSIATASVTLTVTSTAKATPTITWTPPAFIHYGTLLTTSQLNATASVPGSFTYNPTFGTQLSIGSHTLTANFTPTDTTDYNTATKSATLAVYAATPVLTWPTPAPITYGTNLSGTQLDATAATTQGASLAGSFTYSPTSGTSLAAGSHTLTVTFTPSDTVDYVAVSKSVTLTVNKAAPTLTWATPGSIKSGTALSATQLDAKSSVAGTFTYSPASGTVLAVGTHTLSATFTPSNATDYAGGTATVTLTVIGGTKTNPVITWNTPAAITYATKLSGTQLDATANVAGSFTYSPAIGTELSAGSHSITATFTPSNTTTYNTVTKSVALTVNKANPVLTWATPASIAYGTKLSATQLNCKSSVTGTFVYSPVAGTVLSKGTHTLSATFTPSSGNAADYNQASKTVSITVK